MSAWLAGFLAAFVEKLIAALGHDIMELIAKRRNQQANADEAEKSVESLKKAQTGKEIEDATDDALNGL